MKREKKREQNMAKLEMVQVYKSQGMKTVDAISKAGIGSPAYYYQIRKQYGATGAPIESAREIVQVPSNGHSQELKMLRIENQRLRVIVSDYALDIQSLKEFCGRK